MEMERQAGGCLLTRPDPGYGKRGYYPKDENKYEERFLNSFNLFDLNSRKHTKQQIKWCQ